MPPMPELALRPHPDLPSEAVTAITVTIDRPRRDLLSLRYVVSGAIDDVAWPAPAARAFTDGLWKHSCFEAFVGVGDGRPAIPNSTSPLRAEWAAYAFDGYRSGMRRAGDVTVDEILWRRTSDAAALHATVMLPGMADLPVWRIGLSAVIEASGGGKSYWALAHAPGPPDFHNRDCFTARSRHHRSMHEIRYRSAARRPRPARTARRQARRAARASRLGDGGPDPFARRAGRVRRHQAVRRVRPAARPARRQAGQYDGVARTSPIRCTACPVFSLYGEVRRPTGQSMGTFDVLLVDLQDLGCRIYTFITTLRLRARSGGGAWQGGLGARPAQSGRPPDRGADAAARLGELRRRRRRCRCATG